MLWLNDGVSLRKILNGNIYLKPMSDIIKFLVELAILEPMNVDNSTTYSLHSSFATSLRTALCGNGSTWISYPAPGDSSKTAKSVGFLENYAHERWECILYTLVSTQLRDGE